MRWFRRTRPLSVAVLSAAVALTWFGCEVSDGGDDDDDTLTKTMGPTSDWPSFQPGAGVSKPRKPTPSRMPPTAPVTDGTPNTGGEQKPDSNQGGDNGPEPSKESPTAPPSGSGSAIMDAGVRNPIIDAGRAPSQPPAADAAADACERCAVDEDGDDDHHDRHHDSRR
jgi:hypothetical protein